MARTISSGHLSPRLASELTGPKTLCIRPREVDGDGKPYDGANKYVMHFPKGQTPPANGFWSLTMYDANTSLWRIRSTATRVSPRNDLK